jgi:hypothetical protein
VFFIAENKWMESIAGRIRVKRVALRREKNLQ